ncbi:MAG: hypothetical protein M5U09_22010 [Gammaproteobacteria bacterium]|nr:hypothetical protein [Gammaproteobacteria bacterium]
MLPVRNGRQTRRPTPRHYDKDLWGTAGSGTVHCGFEIATDAGFSNIIQTVSGSVLFESQGWTRTTTITGLAENSVYYARAVWTRDPSGTSDILHGAPAILRTPSVSTPTTIRYGLSTCWATGANHCETAMVLCAQNHPTLHAYIQVGDKGYLDNAMVSDSVSTPDAASVRRELLVCQTASPWEWLCTLMATEEQQDDHECPPVLKAISAIPTGSGNINVTVTGHGRLVGDVVSFSNTNSTPASTTTSASSPFQTPTRSPSVRRPPSPLQERGGTVRFPRRRVERPRRGPDRPPLVGGHAGRPGSAFGVFGPGDRINVARRRRPATARRAGPRRSTMPT